MGSSVIQEMVTDKALLEHEAGWPELIPYVYEALEMATGGQANVVVIQSQGSIGLVLQWTPGP